jgi:hypothetical protein
MFEWKTPIVIRSLGAEVKRFQYSTDVSEISGTQIPAEVRNATK